MTTDAGLQPREELFLVEGLFCTACAATVEARLARIAGVEDAAVDFASGAALVRWAPERRDPQAVLRLVDRLGYHARRPDAPAGREGRRDPERRLRLRLAIALFFGMWTMLPSIGLYLDAAPDARVAHGLAWAAAGFSLPVVAWAGRPFYAMGLATLRAGAAGIDALVTLGVLGAVLLSALSLAGGGSDVYFEVAVALVTLQLLARIVDLRVARAGRDALARVLDLRPPQVRREAEDGRFEAVALAAVRVGDVLLVDDGDTLAVDGTVLDGDALVDRSLLTGEATPVPTGASAAVHAGERVVDGALRVRVERAAGDRRIDGLARQVRTLLTAKPPWQRVVDRVARHFLLLATAAAGLGAALALAGGAEALQAAERALAVFVVACPCALSLAAPLPGLVAARRGAEQGILLRDLRAITSGAGADVVFVDKTGTLTTGRPSVRALLPAPGVSPETLLRCAARAELRSRHPFAAAIVAEARAAGLELAAPAEARFETLPARGVRVASHEGTVRVGSAPWLAGEGIPLPPEEPAYESRVWVARDRSLLGAIALHDALRPGAAEAVARLRALGVRVVVLSGDAPGPVKRLAAQLGVEARARCTPEDKVQAVEAARAAGASTAFVGDGLNDGPAIAAA
ncbi:MAG: cation-translocating P-type ATPase, partial [Pseudomonadales bacterium]|nr:cation-translocating P-type ATPase [Pseudomonadales bacterium]